MSLYTPLQSARKLIVGVMSGTSMDGLDLTICEYSTNNVESYNFQLLSCKTAAYPKTLLLKLDRSKYLSATDLLLLDKELGQFFGKEINQFIEEYKIEKSKIDAIASHGHTVFHQPENGFTTQIGCGDTIASVTKIKVINDFRQKDVIAGGQGAPLVPIGDKLLFGDEADAFLNIGGFCNISIPKDEVIAFDISPGNLPLNKIASEFAQSYDKNGEIARSGKVIQEILDELNNLSFYHQNAPKSLGTEWLEDEFYPILNKIASPEDRMSTCVKHISFQIIKCCHDHKIESIFITGGGAFNTFLVEKIKQNSQLKVIIPSPYIIDFKEAIIFGFLGVRFLEGKHNCLASVTGASHNVIGGVLHLP